MTKFVKTNTDDYAASLSALGAKDRVDTQGAVYDALCELWRELGRQPSHSEIALRSGVSAGSVGGVILRLRRAGRILPGRWRGDAVPRVTTAAEGRRGGATSG